jgi:prepilin-type processing-associated H-X9-DG protein
MATNTAGTVARQLPFQAIHYLRANISFADGASKVYTVGVIPAGSQILHTLSGVYVRTVYNAGTNNLLNIGTSDNDDLYGTIMSLTTETFVAIDEAGSATDAWYITNDTTITASHALTGTAATTGAGQVVIAYIPNNDR